MAGHPDQSAVRPAVALVSALCGPIGEAAEQRCIVAGYRYRQLQGNALLEQAEWAAVLEDGARQSVDVFDLYDQNILRMRNRCAENQRYQAQAKLSQLSAPQITPRT